MKLPRDLSGQEVVKALRKLGYQKVRQDGSHVRMTRLGPPEHHLTVPLHPALRPGMLVALLDQVARSLRITRAELIRELFG